MAMKKKDKARDASFVAFVVEQLAPLGEVRSKSMFGGHGVYAGERFFACVDDGRLYFRVDDVTRPRYEARGMGPFTPMPKMVMKSYYEVPVDVIEDAAELARWARDAMAAVPAKKKKGAQPAARKPTRLGAPRQVAKETKAVARRPTRLGAPKKSARAKKRSR